MVREPLTGVDVVRPVTPETIMVVLSPRKTVDAFVRLHDLSHDAFGPGRTLLLNGINVTAKQFEQAVGRHAGNRKVGKVSWQHDPAIQKICDGWPQGIDPNAPGRWASRPTRISTRSSAISSPTISTISSRSRRRLSRRPSCVMR